MKKRIGKYLFTQISGLFVALISVFVLILLIRKIQPSLLDLADLLSISIFMIFFLSVLIGSMILWGKLLVFVGLLTEEEAKGYPYSKPWMEK